MSLKPATRLRKQLCLQIAEGLANIYGVKMPDTEQAAYWVEVMLPYNTTEWEEEVQALEEEWDEEPRPQKPSIMTRLRTAVGCDNLDLIQTIALACDLLEKR